MNVRSLHSFARLLSRWLRGRRRPIVRGRRPALVQLEDRVLLSTATFRGPESLASPVIPITLSAPPTSPKGLTISYAVAAGGTAVAGKDFTLTGTSLVFHQGETVKNLPLTILT